MSFHIYGRHAHLAKRIVQKNESQLVGKLFRYMDVPFERKFDRAVHMAQTLSAHRNVVVATQFDVVDKKTFERAHHTVSLWFNHKGKGYLYDTMGEICGQKSIYMDVYKDYPIVREVLGMDSTRAHSVHGVDTSHYSLFQQLYALEKNWRFLHVQDISLEDVVKHVHCSRFIDLNHYSKSIIERSFPDV